MVDNLDTDVHTIEEKLIKEEKKTRKKVVAPPKPDVPSEIPDDLPKNINFNTDNDKSRAAYSYTLAKVLVIFSLIGAEASKQPAVFMQDEEAIAIAIPAMTILMRMKWFVAATAQYGQYLVSIDEYIMLFWALYMYQARVRKEIDNEPTQRGNAVGPKQADNGRYAKEYARPGELSQVPTFGRDA